MVWISIQETYTFLFFVHSARHLRNRPVDCRIFRQIGELLGHINRQGLARIERPSSEELAHVDNLAHWGTQKPQLKQFLLFKVVPRGAGPPEIRVFWTPTTLIRSHFWFSCTRGVHKKQKFTSSKGGRCLSRGRQHGRLPRNQLQHARRGNGRMSSQTSFVAHSFTLRLPHCRHHILKAVFTRLFISMNEFWEEKFFTSRDFGRELVKWFWFRAVLPEKHASVGLKILKQLWKNSIHCTSAVFAIFSGFAIYPCNSK